MMQAEVRQVAELDQWLAQVAARPFSGTQAELQLLTLLYTIRQRFGPAIQAFQRQRQFIVKDHGAAVKDQPGVMQLSDEGQAEWESMMTSTLRVEAEPLGPDQLHGIGLTMADVLPVAWLFGIGAPAGESPDA